MHKVYLIIIILSISFPIELSKHQFVEIDQPQLRKSGPCITKQQRERLQSNIRNNREISIANGSINRVPNQERVLFAHPLQNSDNYNAFDNYIITDYVNHNPEDPDSLKDWNCGDRTYNNCENDGNDRYYCSHRGTDYTLSNTVMCSGCKW